MWGSCFWLCTPACHLLLLLLRLLLLVLLLLLRPPPPRTQLAHTQLAHTQLTHTQLAHTQLTHTQIVHIQLAHIQLAHIQLAHIQLAHIQLTHTQLAHTQLVHTQLVHTHTTCSHPTCSHPTCSHPTCSHPTCSHTTCPHTRLVHTQLAHTQLVSTQLSHTTYSHATLAGLAAGVALVELGWLCWRSWVPGPLSPLLFVWQAWRLATLTFTLRGRRGTWRHRPSLCVAGVALGDIDVHSAWQVHLCHWAGSGRALGSQLMPWTPRLFVWHVALGDVEVHSAWQAWHFATPMGILRGRRALMALGRLWRRAWVPVDAVDAAAVCVAGAWRHRPSLCVASIALGDIDVHSA